MGILCSELLLDQVIAKVEVLHNNGYIPTASFGEHTRATKSARSFYLHALLSTLTYAMYTDKLLYQFQAEKLDMPNKVSAAAEGSRRPSTSGSVTSVVAVSDFLSDMDGDLSFRLGDSIEIIEDVDENWYRGRLGRKEGIFPKSYVGSRLPVRPPRN
ncbi:hypothetical protein BC829DRAFT_51088 [Chytridium lagenaria]|nr:hypothetical protein BC829DRAFT_51088 [Chytridium lagenaria]